MAFLHGIEIDASINQLVIWQSKCDAITNSQAQRMAKTFGILVFSLSRILFYLDFYEEILE